MSVTGDVTCRGEVQEDGCSVVLDDREVFCECVRLVSECVCTMYMYSNHMRSIYSMVTIHFNRRVANYFNFTFYLLESHH